MLESRFHRDSIEEAIWITDTRAEICNSYLTKGRYIFVEGRLHSYTYTDNDGIQRATMEIVIDDMIMLDGKKPETHQEIVSQPNNNQQVATNNVRLHNRK